MNSGPDGVSSSLGANVPNEPAASDEHVVQARVLTRGPGYDLGNESVRMLISRIDVDAARIAELTRKGTDLCQFAGMMMLAAREVLRIDRAPYQPEAGMDSFSPSAKRLYDLITHPDASGYTEAITAKDARIAELERQRDEWTAMHHDDLQKLDEAEERIDELERVTGPVMPCGCRAVEFDRGGGELFCGKHHTVDNPMPITPKYLAWREGR